MGKATHRQKMRGARTNRVKRLFCCPPHTLFRLSIHRGSPARATPGQRRPQERGVQQHNGSETSPSPGLAAPWCQAIPHARSAPCPGESQTFQRSGQLARTPGFLIHAALKAAKPSAASGRCLGNRPLPPLRTWCRPPRAGRESGNIQHGRHTRGGARSRRETPLPRSQGPSEDGGTAGEPRCRGQDAG